MSLEYFTITLSNIIYKNKSLVEVVKCTYIPPNMIDVNLINSLRSEDLYMNKNE